MDNIRFTYRLDEQQTIITVVGCGGAGSNIITQIYEEKNDCAKLVSLNTDVQCFREVKSDIQLLIGHRQTQGLGTGTDPDSGEAAAKENLDDIRGVINASDLVFVIAGLGGGTGTGSAPIVAQLAQESGALTLAIVTLPFRVEGDNRQRIAELGLKRLRQVTDTVLVIKNDKILNNKSNLLLHEALTNVNKIIVHSVIGISELITTSDLVNLNFADVQSVMGGGDIGMIGLGKCSAENKPQSAMRDAVHSPLLDIDLQHTDAALINITGGPDMSLKEAETVAESLYEQIDTKMQIIWGTSIDRTSEGNTQVLLITTGIDPNYFYNQLYNNSLY